MEKKIIKARFYRIYESDSLAVVRQLLDEAIEAEKSGAWKNIKLVSREYYGMYKVELIGERLETDEEVAYRLKQEQFIEKRDREVYEALKRRFEK